MLKLAKTALGAGALALVVAAAAGAAPASGPDAHAWRTYVNVRYRYAICYPSDLMKAQDEAPNSDGRVFAAADGAELAVFGRNNVEGRSLAATAMADSTDMAGRDGQVTYRAEKKDWAVYSGRNKAGLFYSKTLKRGDQFIIFQLKYPQKDEAGFRPVVERIGQCFSLTK